MAHLEGPAVTPDSQNIKRIVFMLHGYGSNGFDLLQLSAFFKPFLPDTLFIAPNGPRPFPLGEGGHAWFDLPDLSERTNREGVKDAVPMLKDYIETVMKNYHIAPENVVLAGFSQGAMMALHTAPLFKEQLAGVIAFSSPFVKDIFTEIPFETKPPVALIHGTQDDIVPENHFDSATETLKAQNFNVQSLLIEGLAHSIDKQGAEFANTFLKQAFKL